MRRPTPTCPNFSMHITALFFFFPLFYRTPCSPACQTFPCPFFLPIHSLLSHHLPRSSLTHLCCLLQVTHHFLTIHHLYLYLMGLAEKLVSLIYLPYILLFCAFCSFSPCRDSRGHSYFIVRGEILGFMKDEQLRKHLPRMFSLIKNESCRV